MKFIKIIRLRSAGSRIALLSTLFTSLVFTSTSFGTLVAEDFDGYGNNNTSVSGLAGGNGWPAGTSYLATGIPPYYDGGVDLMYFLNGYTNSGSIDGSSGSAFNHNSTAVAGTNYVERAFASSSFTASTTIWASALVAFSGTGPSAIAFVMFNNGGARLGVQGGKLVLANGGGTIVAQSSSTLAPYQTHLLIFRMDLNVSGNDTIKGWMDPIDVSSEAGLGTPAFTYSADSLGTSLANSVRIALRGNASGDYISMDAVRISYGSSAGLAEVVTGTTLTALQSWRQQYFGIISNTGSAADNADPDYDGIPNLLEYALNRNPTAPEVGKAPVSGMANSYLTLTFRKSTIAEGITFHVQVSSDLASWSEVNIAANTIGTSTDTDGTPVLTVRDDVQVGGANRRFMRLMISDPGSPLVNPAEAE
jgi:hypothetical protein